MPIDPVMITSQMLSYSREILTNYSHDFFSFIHNNLYRHHIQDVNHLIQEIDCGNIGSTATLLKRLRAIKLHNPEGDLAKAIGSIEKLQINTLLEKPWFSHQSLLFGAFIDAPETASVLLDEFETLPVEIQLELLSQVDHHGMNLLMYSICYRPQLASLIIDLIKELPPEFQKRILRHRSPLDLNVLMLAAVNSAKLVKRLTELLTVLNDFSLILELIGQYSLNKNTALMLAIQFQPQAVANLLNLLRLLKRDRRGEILNQVDYMGLNIYQLSMIYQRKTIIPQLIIQLCDSVTTSLPLLTPYGSQRKYLLPTASKKAVREQIESSDDLDQLACTAPEFFSARTSTMRAPIDDNDYITNDGLSSSI